MPVQPCVMRPSRVTPVFSTTNRPAPEQAKVPTCTVCQSVMEPSSAEYWHIGETTMRLGSVTPPSSIGVKSLGRGNGYAFFSKDSSEFSCEQRRSRLVAVQAKRVGRDRHALAREARDVALLDHAERLLCRLPRVLDHAAGLVARRERAVVGVAAVGEHLAAHADTRPLCDFIVST